MNKDVKTDDIVREISAKHQREIEEANSWVSSSLHALGESYLEYEEAKLRFDVAEKRLRSNSVTAQQAKIQRAQIMKKIAETLSLTDGEWTFDGGTLVKKE